MSKFFYAICFMLFFNTAFSQLRMVDSTRYSLSAQQAVATFEQAVQLEKEIYTGAEHISYLPAIEGVAYFGSNEWQPGSVFYDGILYPALLKYDLVKDKLILKRPDEFAIVLRSDKVVYFALPAHTFINIDGSENTGLKKGFYERLSSGALTVLAKHLKTVDEKIEETKLHQRFLEETTYYVVKNNGHVVVKNLDSVLDLMESRKGEVQQYLKKNNIKFKKNRELALVAIADYYNKTRP